MEMSHSVDQRARAVDQFFTDYAAELARQGSVVATYRVSRGRRLGPYYQLTCRDTHGQQRTVYLGVDGPFAASVRQRLHDLQHAQHQARQWAQLRRTVRQGLRTARRHLAAELAQFSLTLQGSEIRGWRRRQNSAGGNGL